VSEITSITPQVKDKTRCNIYLDGKFYCGLKFETVVKNRLKVGQNVTERRLNEIQLDSEKSEALEKTFTFITATMKTEKQIRDYLYKKGYLPAVVEYVLEKMRDYRYVDDLDYAQTYVENVGARKGKRLIKQTLFQKGISKENIESALETLETEDQESAAIDVLTKYMRSKEPTRENFAKAFRYLIGKGFDYETAKKAMESFGSLEEESEDGV
jgi:regulatory protein